MWNNRRVSLLHDRAQSVHLIQLNESNFLLAHLIPHKRMWICICDGFTALLLSWGYTDRSLSDSNPAKPEDGSVGCTVVMGFHQPHAFLYTFYPSEHTLILVSSCHFWNVACSQLIRGHTSNCIDPNVTVVQKSKDKYIINKMKTHSQRIPALRREGR